MLSMKKVGNWFAASWVGIMASVIVAGAVIFTLWFGLGNMLPGLTEAEANQSVASSTARQLLDNPLGAPHKALQFITQKLLPDAIGVRSASAIIGVFTVGCFYFVLRSWYSKRVAFLSTLTLVSSAWFLHTVRSGTDDSMYLLLFGAAACVTWLHKSRGKMPATIASAVLITALLYIPGMIWFVIPAFLWQISTIVQLLEKRNVALLTVLGIFCLGALTPLGYAIYHDTDLIKTYFGLPQVFPEPIQIVRNVINVPVELFARGPNDAGSWLGRLPLLNVFASVMFVVGLYAYFRKRQLDRTPFTIFVFVVGTILVGLDGPVSMSIILPFIYLVVAAGIALLLQQWRTVFPRNPFARATGTVLLSIVVLLAAYQGITQYFVAWHNTPETKQVHNQKLE